MFLDRADVEREGEVELAPGTTELQLAGLPSGLLADSIRVSGMGDAELVEA